MKAQTLSFPVGEPVPDWHGRPQPAGVVLTGNDCRLEPVDPACHADALFEAYSQASNDRDWLYLSAGPFPDAQAYRAYTEQMARETDPLHFAVVDLRTGLPVGTLALMRQQSQHGVVEVGFVAFSPVLQRSRIATEWPMVKAAIQQWLAPENYDERGHQIKRLQLIRSHLAASHAGVNVQRGRP